MFIKFNPDGNDGGTAVLDAPDTSTAQPESTQTEAPAQADNASQSQPAPDWRTIELPPQAYAYGKTAGDLVKRYQDSSREAQRLRSRIQELEDQHRQAPQPQTQQTQNAPSPKNNFFGYGSAEAYNQAWEADPEAVMQKSTLYSLRSNPQALRELIEPFRKEWFQPYEQQQQEATFRAKAEAYHAQHPEVRQNPVYLEAVRNYVETHQEEIQGMLSKYPDIDLTAYVCERGLYPIMQQELAASKSRMDTRRASAGSASSGGARTVPKDNSSIEGMAAQVYEASRKAGEPISHEDALAQATAMKQHRIF